MTTQLPTGPLLGNFARALLGTAALHPTKAAVIESETTSAYGELAARSRAIADALSDYGVRPDDRVAMFLAQRRGRGGVVLRGPGDRSDRR